jgi:MFS family permease
MRYAFSNPVARAVVLTVLAAITFLALDLVALPFLVRDTLGGGPAAYGVTFGAFGVGMVVGSVFLAYRPGRSAGVAYIAGVTASGVGMIATGLSPALAAAIVFYGIGGLGNGLDNVASNTLIQRHVPAAVLGRVFGLIATAAYAGQGIAAIAGGLLLDATTPRVVFIISGVGALAAIALALRPILRAERRLGSAREHEKGVFGG